MSGPTAGGSQPAEPTPHADPGQSELMGKLRDLLARAVAAYQGHPAAPGLQALLGRLDEPLRVALAGRLKAGKSTLLNALVGERLAATDATECTRVVTWYANGVASRAWAYPHQGEPRQLRFTRSGGQTVIDLGEFHADDLDRLAIEVPSSRLERLTLIDTPGIGSLSTDVSARTTAFLTEDTDRGADAVLYLMRHLHASDVGFLEAFGDDDLSGSTPVNAIGVLSRSDEVGAGRGDALELARRVAAEYRREPRIRALVQTVVPVSGLLAQAGATLQEADYAALATLAARPGSMLLSADRFVADVPGAALPAERRRQLLGLLGMFGVRLAVALVQQGAAPHASALARELRARGGLDELRTVLLDQFTDRTDVLKAQHALRTLEAVLTAAPVPATDWLRSRVEAVVVGAHELTELRLLNDLRTGAVELAEQELRDEAEALLGASGGTLRARLRLPADAPDEELRPAVIVALRRWQRLGESPMADPGVRRTAAVLRRSCEGLLPSTPRGTPRPTPQLAVPAEPTAQPAGGQESL
ncbi:MAG TPA: dynamin family protein [Mycobacteriales bacterium]|nr:dynamin family protein [Mycobacteriales bacterium]